MEYKLNDEHPMSYISIEDSCGQSIYALRIFRAKTIVGCQEANKNLWMFVITGNFGRKPCAYDVVTYACSYDKI